MIDQGLTDEFYLEQTLLPELFREICQQVGQSLTLRFHQGYDHSYFMISSFIEDHIRYHANAMFI